MSEACPRCARLRDERAREEVLQLRAQLGDSDASIVALMRLGLTRQEARVVGLVLAREMVSRESIAAVLYGDAERQRNPRTIDSLICRARDVLGRCDVAIGNLRGIGWSMDSRSKRNLHQAIAERAA